MTLEVEQVDSSTQCGWAGAPYGATARWTDRGDG